MKLLSVVIPSYNSKDYLDKAVQSLLVGGEEMEIIIVNDGSTDATKEIADQYQKQYPTIIKAIHQKNGGHGSAVITGLKNATGLYFKVVDSDDWVDKDSLFKILDLIRSNYANHIEVDMLIANYVYEKVSLGKQKVIGFKGALPENKVFGWDEIGHFKQSQNILMHSVIYRRQLLIDCKLDLPKHTFYVDNVFVYQPLPYVKTLYYLNVDFYRYFIGREDQSVNESVMMSRIDQQIRVTKLMIDSTDLQEVKEVKLQKYMLKFLSVMMMVSTVYLIKIDTKESLEKKEELWDYLKKAHPAMYKEIRYSTLGCGMNLPGHSGRAIIKVGYNISKKIFGFA